MPKRTVTLILALILIAGGLVFLALSAIPPKQDSLKTSNVPTQVPFAHTTLSLSPNPAVSTQTANIPIAVMIDSNGDKVSGVQLELSFNPKELTIADIVSETADSPSFFPKATQLLKVIDQRNGKVTYTLALSTAEKAKAGSGTVAIITARVAPGVKQTKLNLLTSSIVTATGITQSVLKSATGTTITAN